MLLLKARRALNVRPLKRNNCSMQYNQRILDSIDTLRSWADEQSADETGVGVSVERLESGALVVNSVVEHPETGLPIAVEAFFPANLDAHPSIIGELDGTKRIFPRKQFPQMVELLLANTD